MIQRIKVYFSSFTSRCVTKKKRKKDYLLISSKTLYVQWSIIHVNDVYFTFSGLKCNFTESTESNIPAKMLNSGGCGMVEL